MITADKGSNFHAHSSCLSISATYSPTSIVSLRLPMEGHAHLFSDQYLKTCPMLFSFWEAPKCALHQQGCVLHLRNYPKAVENSGWEKRLMSSVSFIVVSVTEQLRPPLRWSPNLYVPSDISVAPCGVPSLLSSTGFRFDLCLIANYQPVSISSIVRFVHVLSYHSLLN